MAGVPVTANGYIVIGLETPAVQTLAELQALTLYPDVVSVACKTTIGDGWGGLFAYDATSTATPDDALVVAPTSGVGRWLRVYDGGINVRWFGIDSASVQAAFSAANALGGGTVVMGLPGDQFVLNNVSLTGAVNVEGMGNIVIPGPGADYSIKVFQGYAGAIRNVQFKDQFNQTVVSTTTSSSVSAGAMTIPLASVSRFAVGKIVSLKLASGAAFVTTVVSVGVNSISTLDAVPNSLTTVAVANGGTGYAVNNVLTAQGLNGVPFTLLVTSVSGGVITGLSILCPGRLATVPSNPVILSDGSGSGAAVNLTWDGALNGAMVTCANGQLLVDQSQNWRGENLTFLYGGVGLQVIDTSSGIWNTSDCFFSKVFCNGQTIACIARGTKVANTTISDVSAYGWGGSAGTYGAVGYYADASNPGSLPPGGNYLVNARFLNVEIGLQSINCQLDYYVDLISDTVRDCAVYLSNTTNTNFAGTTWPSFTGPQAISGIGGQGIGLCFINSVNNKIDGVYATSDESPLGFVYFDTTSLTATSWQDTRLLSGCTTAPIAGNASYGLGPSGAGSNLGAAWTMGDPQTYTLYFQCVCDTAPGASQSFTYQLTHNGTPIGLTGTISGGSSFTTGAVPISIFANRTDRIGIKLVASAGAASANHFWLIMVRHS